MRRSSARRWKYPSAPARKAARFPPSATARKTTANAATNKASSSGASFLLPSIVFHDKSRHRLDFFLLEHKTFALIPAPGFFIFAHTAQRNFIRQMLSRESEQSSAEVLALIFRGDEQLVDIEFGQMQRQHRRKLPVIVGDKEVPAFLYLERNARAQLRQQEIACRFEAGRSPTVHPDAGDLVIFVDAGGTDRWWRHSNCPRQRRRRVRRKEEAPATISRGLLQLNQMRKFTPPLASPAASSAAGRFQSPWGGRKTFPSRGSSPWSTP